MIGKADLVRGASIIVCSVRMQWVISVKYCVRVRMQ
jgi:hypothetical protein